jgi:hypothetical protein
MRNVLLFVSAALLTLVLASCEQVTQIEQGEKRRDSRMLCEVKAKYSSRVIADPKSSSTQGWFDDVINWINDAATVAYEDLKGVPAGAGVGAAAGAVFGDPVTGAAVGGTITGVLASIKAYNELPPIIAGGSAAGGTAQQTGELNRNHIRPCLDAPYSNPTKPDGIDSLGWIHNDGVLYALDAIEKDPTMSIVQAVEKWAIHSRGYDSAFVTLLRPTMISIASSQQLQLNPAVGFLARPAAYYGQTRPTESAYMTQLHEEMQMLYEGRYEFNAILDLIRLYRDNASSLPLSANNVGLLRHELTIYLYSLALWGSNVN